MTALYLVVASAVLYGCASALCIYRIKHESQRFTNAYRALFFLALLIHSVSIGVVSTSTAGTLLQGPNVLMLASWVLSVAFGFFNTINKKSYSYGAFVLPVILLLMCTAEFMSIYFNGLELYNRVFNEWPMLVVHIICFLVAIACFVIGAVASGMLLYQQKLARSRDAKFLSLHLPALSTLKTIAGRATVIGLPFFTAGMLLGFARYLVLLGSMMASGCGGDLLYLIPRILLSLLVESAYIVYLVFIYLMPGRLSSRVCSFLSIVSGVAAILLAILSSTAVV